jgi:hypothetical protein
VDGDRCRAVGVVDAVDVPGGSKATDIAGVVVVDREELEVLVVQLLVLDALDDADDTPRDVVVVRVSCPGRQTTATIEKDPSGSTCRV